MPLSLIVVAIGEGKLDDFGIIFRHGYGTCNVSAVFVSSGFCRLGADCAFFVAGVSGDGNALFPGMLRLGRIRRSSIPVSRSVPAIVYLFERPSRL